VEFPLTFNKLKFPGSTNLRLHYVLIHLSFMEINIMVFLKKT